MAAVATTDIARDSGSLGPQTERSTQRLFEPQRPDGGVSLEERLLAVWEDLTRQGHAGCPVCGGRIHVASGCGDCGSELS